MTTSSSGGADGRRPARRRARLVRPRILRQRPLPSSALASAMPSGLRMAVRIRPIAPIIGTYCSNPPLGTLVDELGDDAAGNQQPADHRAVQAGDAAEVDEGECGQRGEQPVVLRLDRSEPVALHHAGETGDGRGDGEAEQLRPGDVDAGGRRGALVGPHGEEPPPGGPSTQPGDAEGDEHGDDHGEDREAPVVGAGGVRVGGADVTFRTRTGAGRGSSRPPPRRTGTRS